MSRIQIIVAYNCFGCCASTVYYYKLCAGNIDDKLYLQRWQKFASVHQSNILALLRLPVINIEPVPSSIPCDPIESQIGAGAKAGDLFSLHRPFPL